MSAPGTKRTFQDVCYLVAIGGKADIFCSLRAFPLLTQLRHGRLKTFAAQKHCSFFR